MRDSIVIAALALTAGCVTHASSGGMGSGTGSGSGNGSGSGSGSGSGEMAVEPRTCSAHITLAPVDSGMPATQELPLTLDHDGVDLCIHLDPSALVRAHFAASSSPEPGTASSLMSRLEDPTFTPIVDGWDVTIGSTDPTTRMTLEWSPATTAPLDVVVWLHAVQDTATTKVAVTLFDPLE